MCVWGGGERGKDVSACERDNEEGRRSRGCDCMCVT